MGASKSPSTTAMITPPPSADIIPRDPLGVTDISSLLLPPAFTVDAVKPEDVDSARTKVSTRSAKSAKLPPPPMRSRRIIEMQPVLPKPVKTITKTTGSAAAPTSSSATAFTSPAAITPAGPAAAPKSKRNANGTTAATRKTARKIAHSAIERRRRSKMNEEFESLRNMVPACRVASQTHGEASLHKLGILQATVEYLRYLEGCIGQLQSRVECLEAGGDTEDKVSLDEAPSGIKAMEDELSDDDEEEEDEDENQAARLPSPVQSLFHHSSVSSSSSYADEVEMEEAGKEVSRTLLMLRQVSDPSVPSLASGGRGIRVCDLLG
ncbi:hypothetical protein BZA70DRAFT_282724 [Myxozyma melibiosi]|uniref:BHLH domain-containing protein n=1 Tax=Myxozyma melibiosi TaxID=54550 RepID=A0ABR1F190_9ASCO